MLEKCTDLGIGLWCSVDGIVTRVVYDGLGLQGRIAPGRSFSSIFEPESVNASRDFLRALRDGQNVDDWPLETNSMPLRFWGVHNDGCLKIAGALTRNGAVRIGRNLLNGNDKEHGVQGGHVDPDRSSSEDLRSINNQLAKAQRELVKRNLHLEASSQEKTHWLGMAAHDLRHPLSAILVNSELLIEDAATFSEDQKMLLDSIYSSCQSMLQLLDDVLDLSSIESGIQRLGPQPTELRALIDESIALCRPLADRKMTRIELRYEESRLVVSLDRAKVRQVLVNLIGNAIKYSQKGAKVEVKVVVEHGNALISVQDNGPGIPSEELDSIFNAFQKTRARAASAEPGTGLGLAICKRIVERHGGRIWAESTRGQGAAFRFSLALDAPSNRRSKTAKIY